MSLTGWLTGSDDDSWYDWLSPAHNVRKLGSGAEKLYGEVTNKDGKQAAQDAMSQARTQLGQLRDQQHAQRQQDLQRAMGYFQPTNTLLNKMYGTAMPAPYQTDAQMGQTLQQGADLRKPRLPSDAGRLFGTGPRGLSAGPGPAAPDLSGLNGGSPFDLVQRVGQATGMPTNPWDLMALARKQGGG